MEGEVFKNNQGLSFVVVKKMESKRYLVRFVETGYETVAYTHLIRKGSVKDKYHKSICGVACIGNVRNVHKTKSYSVWVSMIHRCYDYKSSNYKSYGAKGVHVCERWLCFENFINDISSINGYDESMFNKGEIHLDKDIKQQSSKCKVYSLETCSFVTQKDNNEARSYNTVEAMSPNNELFIIDNISLFAKDNRLNRQMIHRCLKGEYKQHKGWRFSYADCL